MISSGLSPAPDFVSSNFCLKSERFGRLSLTLRSSDFELSRSRRSTTRGFRWRRMLVMLTRLALDCSMTARRSLLGLRALLAACDFLLSLLLKMHAQVALLFSLGRSKERSRESRTLANACSLLCRAPQTCAKGAKMAAMAASCLFADRPWI
ncbi:hypothetical protein F2Q68_00005159 [Brassica cretica]|uniref:Uncharacterized protein n=1 Tax=Brassica cretica TaxID=69181 RepID=A0A8S9JJ58_BRACR|nr:hypothetical protein F2Q68_00005159 [Brassica cretica]